MQLSPTAANLAYRHKAPAQYGSQHPAREERLALAKGERPYRHEKFVAQTGIEELTGEVTTADWTCPEF